jgi:hypothetical protein
MEKLIELLNEFYDKEKWGVFNAIEHRDNQRVFKLGNDDRVRDTAVISKEYWFIKWLVDNDKIDFDKIQIWFQLTLWYWKYDSLLMLLSISDTPIEDLISYFK